MGGRGGSSASAGRGVSGEGIDRILAESSGDAAAAIDAITAYMYDNYETDISGLGNLPLESVVDAAKGVEDVINEYPSEYLNGWMFDMTATNTGASYYAKCYMRPNGSDIDVNATKFKDHASLEQSYDSDVRFDFHPQGTTVQQITSHEAGHVIEVGLVSKKHESDTDNSGMLYDLSNHTEAKRVVNNAASKVKSTSAGKGKTTKALRGEISGYADSTKSGKVAWTETLAEAVADYAANGSNAKPLSVAIHDELKSELG